ncbi:hypothetical protein BY458DRAFT_492847 [Sporodiniella umbellata]|nr:hypothetical protein BY458DRAFT_492847 [Sporodiniella umbellata]
MQSYSDYFFFSRQTLEQCSDDRAVTSPEEFEIVICDYLSCLSPKKRDKALIDDSRYTMIRKVLKNPRDTSTSTAQFRFWVKKMFYLSPRSQDAIYHDQKPVATKENIYQILVSAHKEANHGGRDKTSSIVKCQYSWIPKELVARFVRCCPTCKTRRTGSSGASPYEFDTHPSEAESPKLSGSVETTPSPDLNCYFESLPEPCRVFEPYDYLHEPRTYLNDMLVTFKLSSSPELLNPNDVLESIMRDWSQQQENNSLLLSDTRGL